MATAKKTWAAATTIIAAASVTDTPVNSTTVDMVTNGYEGTHITVDADFPGGPTDHLEVYVETSIDGTNFDEVPYQAFVVRNETDPSQLSLILKDVAYFRITVNASGVTDTITVTVKERSWRFDIT
jgi:hypothetical protein